MCIIRHSNSIRIDYGALKKINDSQTNMSKYTSDSFIFEYL